MAVKTIQKPKRPCVDGTQAYHTVFEAPMGGLVAGECIRGCGHSEVVAETPAAIKKLQEFDR